MQRGDASDSLAQLREGTAKFYIADRLLLLLLRILNQTAQQPQTMPRRAPIPALPACGRRRAAVQRGRRRPADQPSPYSPGPRLKAAAPALHHGGSWSPSKGTGRP